MKLTGEIIGAAMEVHRLLGPGFVEAVYHRALFHELKLRSMEIETERPHRLDMVVQKCVVVELKAVSVRSHRAGELEI